ncbi:4,5-dihydroxyphthalate decarboxylase [Frondihabitans australicus]|uniref:4,5-dihydroxyphthalate decarboxylase n=1 Tax=Frondihabitans australicus TaxID=386892 RepID=A0A495IM02_9MICO|nr:4,5-dihydroxyphthalate decarboxylase [Frondihabitans australicus]RKR76458.1 4,5-dihydroxyphthalate decarboxylase [Frondihabitans australicus]
MSPARLRFGSMPYDMLRGLIDGDVTVDGDRVEYTTCDLATDVFEPMIRDQAFDVAELGLTYYLRTLDAAAAAGTTPPFVALPVFPARVFRQSSIFVREGGGIDRPADLAGRRVGEFALYGHDAGVWAKGVLADEFGVDPASMSWIVGGLERSLPPADYVSQPRPDGVAVSTATRGADLGAMLEQGEIDALFSGNVPRAVLEGSPRVRRLFVDYRSVEQEYFARTGIFPPAHVLVMRRDLVEARPGLAHAVSDACAEAKARAQERATLGRVTNFATSMLPWLNDLADRDAALLGPDPFAFGVAANRVAIETFLRYHHEQGLSRRFAVDEVFAQELLDT